MTYFWQWWTQWWSETRHCGIWGPHENLDLLIHGGEGGWGGVCGCEEPETCPLSQVSAHQASSPAVTSNTSASKSEANAAANAQLAHVCAVNHTHPELKKTFVLVDKPEMITQPSLSYLSRNNYLHLYPEHLSTRMFLSVYFISGVLGRCRGGGVFIFEYSCV